MQTARKAVGQCIYCGAHGSLSDEHVLPFGLGGNLILEKASCESCARTTSQLEGRLLRGHWLPYRFILGLPSRRPKDQPKYTSVLITSADGTEYAAQIPTRRQSLAIGFEFGHPSILKDSIVSGEPAASRAYMKPLAELPRSVLVNGARKYLEPTDKITVPTNFDSADLCRFLAKVAHGYAIFQRGSDVCDQYFLPEYILGRTDAILSYVGGNSSPVMGPRLPGRDIHAMMDRVNGAYLTVCIQLFRDKGDPPPIYEVVVGTLGDPSAG